MDQKIVCGIGKDRPNYRIEYLSKYVDRVDAEMFLTNLPISVRLQDMRAVIPVPLVARVDARTVSIFPPLGNEIRGILFEQEGEGGKAAAKIRLHTIAKDIFNEDENQVVNECTTIKVSPIDLGVTGWVGLYGFQREQGANDEILVYIYRRSL